MSVVKQRPTILIVEDELAILEDVSTTLRNAGYEIAAAANGREALTLLRGGLRPSLVLLDLVMPEMNGWEFRAEQLEDPEFKLIPVVIVTGASERPMDPVLSNVAGKLRKPIDGDVLVGTVDRLIGLP